MQGKLIALIARHVAPPRYLVFAALFILVLAGMWSGGVALQIALLGSFDIAALVFFLSALPLLNDDVTINGAHMRRVVLAQTVAAFFFNMGVLAFAINTLGSL